MYELSDFGNTKPLLPAAKMPEKDRWRNEPAQEKFTNTSDIQDEQTNIFEERGTRMGDAAHMYAD